MKSYRIYKNIDKESRIVGLTLDEFIPVMSVLILGFVMKVLLLAMVASTVIVLLLRHVKKGRRGHFLLNLLYWYAPDFVVKHHFSVTPAAEKRFWLR